MLATLYSLGTLATIALAAFGIGRPIVRWLKIGDEGLLDAMVWSFGLGLVVTGWVLSVTVLTGLMTPVLVGLLTIVGSFWGLGELACAYLVIRNPLHVDVAVLDDLMGRMQPKPPSLWFRSAVALGFTVALLATLVMAMAPTTSPAALSRSLELPKTIALGCPIQEETLTTPQFGGMFYAWALLIDGPVAATLLAWFFGVLLAAATTLLARGVVGRAWSWIAGALVLLSPGVVHLMSAPLDDLPMAAFATLSLTAWWRGAVEILSPRWFILAGVFLGAALATKAVAVVLLVAVAITWSMEAARRNEHRYEVAIGAAASVLTALVIACPWWTWVIARGGLLATADRGPSWLFQLGPWFLAVVPGLVLARRLRGLHLLVSVVVCYLIAGGLLVPQSRVFAPLVPLLATMSVWVCMELCRLPMPARRVAIPALVASAGLLNLVHLAPIADRWGVACGMETRAAYLGNRVGAYPAAIVANHVVQSDSRLLSQDACGLYFDCPVTSAAEPAETAIAGCERGLPNQLIRVRDLGFTHVLLCSPEGVEGNNFLSQAVAADLANPEPVAVLPLTEYRFTNAAGCCWRYQLLMLRQ